MATVTATVLPAGQREQEPEQEQEPCHYLRKYLLLLATLVATVTYSTGFTPPGGVWQDSTADHLAGDPIIRDIRYIRYVVFFYCNASAFAWSLLVVALLLLIGVLHEDGNFWDIQLRVVMVLDLISLIMAYAAGTCRDTFTKVYTCSLLLVSAVAYLVLQMVLPLWPPSPASDEESRARAGKPQKRRSRKILLLLATFAVGLTYSAGINTPGGFWDNDEDGHRPGDAILKEHHRHVWPSFFVCNTTAFIASLFIVLLLLDKKLRKAGPAPYVLYGCIVVALLSLVGAYAAGSSRESATTTYVVRLVAAVLLCILLQLVIVNWPWSSGVDSNTRDKQHNDAVDKARSLVLLLATLAATITYQAGLHPPGGVWQETVHGHHIAGDPILLTTKPRRYKAFFYCNSVAFVASLVVIVLVQNKKLIEHHALEAAMVLDLFGLIGAYAAGTCRDVSTSIYVMAMVGAVLVYVVLHVIFFTLHHMEHDDQLAEQVEKRRKRLLLFAILAATISYQAGLTPPSGFLLKDEPSIGRHAGDPILLYNSVRRYTVFFYCNSASFMLSMALIILLVNPNMYKPAIRSYALSVCTAVGLFGLVGAYAIGSTQHRSTSISVIVMTVVVLLVMLLLLIVSLVKGGVKNTTTATTDAVVTSKSAAATTTDADVAPKSVAADEEEEDSRKKRATITAIAAAPRIVMEEDQKKKKHATIATDAATAPKIATEEDLKKQKHAKRKYLMLLGILVASVTYQVGLDQPGGVWQSNKDGHNAGNPVMRDNRGLRYHIFFYCNSTAFVASIVVIILLLPLVDWLNEKKEKWWFRVMKTTVLLDLLSLLGAYAIGSSRSKKTSAYVIMLIFTVLAYAFFHWILSCSCCITSSPEPKPELETMQPVLLSHQQRNIRDIPA